MRNFLSHPSLKKYLGVALFIFSISLPYVKSLLLVIKEVLNVPGYLDGIKTWRIDWLPNMLNGNLSQWLPSFQTTLILLGIGLIFSDLEVVKKGVIRRFTRGVRTFMKLDEKYIPKTDALDVILSSSWLKGRRPSSRSSSLFAMNLLTMHTKQEDLYAHEFSESAFEAFCDARRDAWSEKDDSIQVSLTALEKWLALQFREDVVTKFGDINSL